MIKLRRYLKPYAAMLLAGVALLLGQAFLELSLPNLMSRIVNIGIQQGGIEEAAPKAAPQDIFRLLLRLMPQADAGLARDAYTEFSQLPPRDQERWRETFPAAAPGTMVRTGDAPLDGAFSRADYALMQLASGLARESGQRVASSTQNDAEFDLDALYAMLPRLEAAAPGEAQRLTAQAAAASDTTIGGVAAVMNKAFYQALGADTDWMQTSFIMRTGGVMLLLCLVGVGCAAGAGLCFSRFGAGAARDLRRDIFSSVTGFTNNEMDKFSTASLITRTTNDVTQVQMLLTVGVRMLCFAPIMGVGGIVMAVSKSPDMAWIIAVAVLAILGIITALFSIAMPRFNLMQKLVDRLNLVSRENLSGMMVVRAFGTQEFEEGRFDKANRDLADNTLFVNRVISAMMPIMMFIMNAVALFIVWLGARQIAASAMQVGDMMAFIQYAMQIIMSFLMISMMFIMIPRAFVSASRIHEVLASRPAVRDPEQPQTLDGHVRGEVAFHDVSFKYEGAQEYVLRHVSFTAKPGETTAIIGSTGSGKSTLVNLIPRFYDVTEGCVTLDGVDIRQLRQHDLRRAIGYVPQKGMLFAGDVAGNICYGGRSPDETSMRRAAQIAQAAGFIERLPGGYQAEISQGGGNVSGGQRQRLSIARALAGKTPVYIFDDAFSALDFATDAKLRKALGPYTRESAVLLVAQRVSTIMYAEKIIVLDEGRVAGIGTHGELLRQCAAYREIAQSQLSEEELA